MSTDNEIPTRPRRTREHVIASQSRNYIEKFFIDKGHTADRPSEDYGYDLVVNTFDEHGYAENGEILIQLKASDHLTYLKTEASISFEIARKHYELWTNEFMPVFLIAYDSQSVKAYWLYVQAYFAFDLSRTPKAEAQSRVVRIPVANEFTEATVDYIRERKSRIYTQVGPKVHHDAQ